VKDYENAEKYLFEGLEGVKKVGDKFMEATSYASLGFFYEDKGDKETAREYLLVHTIFINLSGQKDMVRVF
jgi:hypothetical protein